MKKTTLIVCSLFLIATSMISCKKDYLCKCSKTYTSGTGGTNTSSYSQFTYRENRARAEDRCNENATTSSDLFGNYSINCQIQ
ncbi:MAG: hypothetical protein IT257_07390 [Chitinophagaceae bacterium]|nr:hypothetical protein [Chitinophagaceae bacterium]